MHRTKVLFALIIVVVIFMVVDMMLFEDKEEFDKVLLSLRDGVIRGIIFGLIVAGNFSEFLVQVATWGVLSAASVRIIDEINKIRSKKN